MQDAAPPDVRGYVVVGLPDQASWQGLFARPAFRDLQSCRLGR